MALQDVIFTDRFVNKSPALANENLRAMLLVVGAATLATAGIGKAFFDMDKVTASITAGAGAAIVASAVTENDGYLCLLGVAAVTATGVATIQAFRDGRFYVKVDLADLFRLGFDIFKHNRAG